MFQSEMDMVSPVLYMKFTTRHNRFPRFARLLRSLLAAILMLGLIIVAWNYAAPPQAVVATQNSGNYAKDGDSIDTKLANGARRIIRLEGIDAPELHQTCTTAAGTAWPCGAMARSALSVIIKDAALTCKISATDQFGRDLATCATAVIPDVGAHLVGNGWAVSGVEKTDSRWENGGPYLLEQAQAQKARRGIWQGEFVRPADWRAANPR